MISRPEHQLRSVFVSAENKRKINIKTGAPPRCSLKLSFYFVFSFPVFFYAWILTNASPREPSDPFRYFIKGMFKTVSAVRKIKT